MLLAGFFCAFLSFLPFFHLEVNVLTEIKKSINATTLKILAAVLMVFDHVHQMFWPVGAPDWLTWLGRPVFPIFLFIMAESFYYTHDRKKLMIRLLMASWLMTVFNFVLGAFILPSDDIVLMNNAFSTFFVSVLYMLFWDMFVEGIKAKKVLKIICAILLCFVPVLATAPLILVTTLETLPPLWLIRALFFIPNILIIEGGPAMAALGVLFYALRSWRLAQVAVLVALSIIVYVNSPESAQWMMVFAAIPILLYNGEKGRGMKHFFYIFYPAHIYLLYIIAVLFSS